MIFWLIVMIATALAVEIWLQARALKAKQPGVPHNHTPYWVGRVLFFAIGILLLFKFQIGWWLLYTALFVYGFWGLFFDVLLNLRMGWDPLYIGNTANYDAINHWLANTLFDNRLTRWLTKVTGIQMPQINKQTTFMLQFTIEALAALIGAAYFLQWSQSPPPWQW